jgi:hypothetical protein
MVKQALLPQHQGHIDGMCAVYSVLNACKLLFDHSEKLDRQLFKALCEAVPDLFPNIVYDGTQVAGVSRLLDAAKAWTNHIHKRELIWSGLAAGLRRLASALVRPRCRRSHL